MHCLRILWLHDFLLLFMAASWIYCLPLYECCGCCTNERLWLMYKYIACCFINVMAAAWILLPLYEALPLLNINAAVDLRVPPLLDVRMRTWSTAPHDAQECCRINFMIRSCLLLHVDITAATTIELRLCCMIFLPPFLQVLMQACHVIAACMPCLCSCNTIYWPFNIFLLARALHCCHLHHFTPATKCVTTLQSLLVPFPHPPTLSLIMHCMDAKLAYISMVNNVC